MGLIVPQRLSRDIVWRIFRCFRGRLFAANVQLHAGNMRKVKLDSAWKAPRSAFDLTRRALRCQRRAKRQVKPCHDGS